MPASGRVASRGHSLSPRDEATRATVEEHNAANRRALRIDLALVLVALSLRVLTSGTAGASYLVLSAYALRGTRQSVEALALSWFFTMLSDGVAPPPSGATLLRFVVIACAASSVLLRPGGRPIGNVVVGPLAVGAYAIVHSALISPMPMISILKAAAWTITALTLMAACSRLSNRAYDLLTTHLFGGLLLVLLVSAPLAATGTGYLRTGTGFQGILGHPQTFGPTFAMFGAWCAGRLLARPHVTFWRGVQMAGIGVAVVLSESRTAALSLFLGVGVACLMTAVMKGPIRRSMPGLASGRLHLLFFCTVFGLIAAGPFIVPRMAGFFEKHGQSGSLVDSYDASRGGLVRKMYENIERRPLTGIGFGVPSDPTAARIERDTTFDIPTSASVEKGVLPIAVVEELGTPGALLVLAWFFFVVRRSHQAGLTQCAVVLTVLLTNLGEATLFSVGGLGLLFLIGLSWGVCGSRRYSETVRSVESC